MRRYYLLFLGIAAASLVSGWWLVAHGFYAISADESGRTLEAYTWLAQGNLNGSVWLPLHRIIVGEALGVFPDLFTVPRAISAVFGVIALSGLMLLAQSLFESFEITLLTGILGLLFGPLTVLSIVPLSDILFIAFAVAGCAFLVRHVTCGKSKWLFLCALMFMIASLVRYEAWMFSLALCGYCAVSRLTRDDMPWSLLLGITALSVCVPLYWTTTWYASNGSLSFISNPGNRYLETHGGKLFWSDTLPVQFLQQNLVSLNILGMVSLVGFLGMSSKIRRYTSVPILSFLAMAIASVIATARPSHNAWRVPTVWSVLLIPFTAQWLIQRYKNLLATNFSLKWSMSGLVLLAVFTGFVSQRSTVTSESTFSAFDRSAGEFVNPGSSTARPTQKILIEPCDWSYVHVLIASRHPEIFVLNSSADPLNQKEYLISPHAAITNRRLDSLGVHYLLFKSLFMKDFLDTSACIRTEREFGQWKLYSIVQ